VLLGEGAVEALLRGGLLLLLERKREGLVLVRKIRIRVPIQFI
jgi:hypothetical protein